MLLPFFSLHFCMSASIYALKFVAATFPYCVCRCVIGVMRKTLWEMWEKGPQHQNFDKIIFLMAAVPNKN